MREFLSILPSNASLTLEDESVAPVVFPQALPLPQIACLRVKTYGSPRSTLASLPFEEALQINRGPRVLDINLSLGDRGLHCLIGHDRATVFFANLGNNQSLKGLSVSVGREYKDSFVSALKAETCLERLTVSLLDMTIDQQICVIRSVKHHPCLTELNFKFGLPNQSHIDAFHEVLMINKHVKNADLGVRGWSTPLGSWNVQIEPLLEVNRFREKFQHFQQLKSTPAAALPHALGRFSQNTWFVEVLEATVWPQNCG